MGNPLDRFEPWGRAWIKALQMELQKMQNPDARGMKKATPIPIDFQYTMDVVDEPMGHKPFPVVIKLDPDGKTLTPELIKTRFRKKRARKAGIVTAKPYELAVAYAKRKPLDEWDAEELARGRPRNKDGSFRGPRPEYVTMAVHEEAIDKFAKYIKTEMNVQTVSAIDQIKKILENEEQDYRGKPVIPASVKLDAAKFMIEHLVGKPKQHIEQDVSIKLQSILGSVIVNPHDETTEEDLYGYTPAHTPGVTMELASMEDANGLSDE